MADDRIKILEERLTRLEAALSQQPAATPGFTPPGGVVVDPAPWGGGGWTRFHPPPIVDMAPWWGGGWGGWHPRFPPGTVVDPGPFPNPVVDPAPGGGGVFARPTGGTTLGRIGQIGDPPPPDVSRFTVAQLESSLHTINAEKARLSSMETMITQQLEKLKKQG